MKLGFSVTRLLIGWISREHQFEKLDKGRFAVSH